MEVDRRCKDLCRAVATGNECEGMEERGGIEVAVIIM